MASVEDINRQALGSADQIADSLRNNRTVIPMRNKNGVLGVKAGNWRPQKGQEALMAPYVLQTRQYNVKTESRQKKERDAAKDRKTSNDRGYETGNKPIFYHLAKTVKRKKGITTSYTPVQRLKVASLTAKNRQAYFSKLKNKVEHVMDWCFDEEKRKENMAKEETKRLANDDKTLVKDDNKVFFERLKELKDDLDENNFEGVQAKIEEACKKIVEAAKDMNIRFAHHSSMPPISFADDTVGFIKLEEEKEPVYIMDEKQGTLVEKKDKNGGVVEKQKKQLYASFFARAHEKLADGRYKPFSGFPKWATFTSPINDIRTCAWWCEFFDSVNGYSSSELTKTDQERQSDRRKAAAKTAEKAELNPTFYITADSSKCGALANFNTLRA